MTLKDSAWKDSRGAAAKASLTANRHICGEAEIDVGKAKILMDEGFRWVLFLRQLRLNAKFVMDK